MALPYGNTARWRFTKSNIYNPNTLKGYFQLNDLTYVDHSGNGAAFSVGAGTPVLKRIQKFGVSRPSLSMSGSQMLSRSSPIVWTSPWSISMLVRRNNLGTITQTILTSNFGSGASTARQVLVRVASGDLTLYAGAVGSFYYVATGLLKDDNLHLITLTSAGGDVRPNFFFDGKFVSNLNGGSISNFTNWNNADTYIGDFKYADIGGTNNEKWEGEVSELIFDQREWGIQEVSAYYQWLSVGNAVVSMKNRIMVGTGATDVTVSSSVVTATFSIPAVSVSTDTVISSSVVNATFSVQAPSVTGEAQVSPSVLSATFSIPLPNIITPDALVNASVVSASFSTQATSVTGQAIVSSSVLTATFSQPSASFIGDVSITPSAQNATFSIQTPTISAVGNVTVSVSVVSSIFSIQSPTVTAETFAEAGVVSATFSTLSVIVTATRSVTVDASVMTATFSVVKPLRKVGGLWTAQPRNEGVWVPQGRVA